ncbi:hypothetical protein HU200_056573 [Digitaria exilis]|uniref:FAD-binding PCMH-type domain-containing protein n=1 Tax=Digitaria exilis TaxID=1010633 RepID=A0A835ALA3_9POAL|nr:hypothetical protein HU200_056573 [Digitaria exilis]
MATTRRIIHLILALCILYTTGTSSSASSDVDAFLGCLSADIPPRLVLTPATSNYSELLLSSVRNLRYVLPGTVRPLAIVAATEATHVQTTVICGRRHSVRVRTRSGGHDYEGLSYASLDPHQQFAVLDLAELRAIHIDAERAEAWVESGASLGELYYAVGAANRTLAFPAGSCPTVCFGGHLSGGGFGSLARKYGLSADNVLDALVVDAQGRILDRSTMGEELFWAIRGGGGESFGVVLSWKVRLVRVPEIVTVFGIRRFRNQSAIDLITKWQDVAPALPRDLYLRVLVQNPQADFVALFLGRCDRLVHILQRRFPELGMTQSDCQEISWNPRAVYVNYRDLDLGTNELEGNVTSYEKAKVWGEKYFKGNFERLAAVKGKVDPDDFFRNEQSIPPLPPKR